MYFAVPTSHVFLKILFLYGCVMNITQTYNKIHVLNDVIALVFFFIYFAAFEIQVLSMLTIKCQGNFRIFQFASAYGSAKNYLRLSRNLCILHRQWLQDTLAFFQGLWWVLLTVETTCSKLYCLLTTHLNRWHGRQYFPCWLPCFGFLVCPCCGIRTHPNLEKPKI